MALDEIAPEIQNLEVFHGTSPQTIAEVLPLSTTLTFARGQTILAQNAPPNNLYFLCSGRAEVVLHDDNGQKVVLAQINSGEHFGEMSLLTGDPTSASIVAADTCKVLVIAPEGFRYLLDRVPRFRENILNTLSLRLKKANYGVLEAHAKEMALADMLSDRQGKYGKIVGRNREVKKIRDDLLKKWADSKSPLYLVGDKGTGRELVARSIHRCGSRKERPFIAVNCEDLVAGGAAEKLFGQFGYLELVNGGTLMLKNVELLSPSVLDKISEFLKHPLVDVRLISASSEKGYDSGWLHRLASETVSHLFANVVGIPPLRNRKRDIPELLNHFLNKYSSIHNRPTPLVSKDAMEKLLLYDYPYGNVQELEGVLERAFLLAEDNSISGEHIFLGKVEEKNGWKYNLLQLKPVIQAIQKKIFPEGLQWAVTVVFAYILVSCFTGTGIGPSAQSLV
ncbi:MAG: cyclic nucleotide-binding domain-containing protein [Syntrophothermus sp.]|uniref:cyclic nucleotide-binding domain-containing protein n=1 Tax=Syntrophothermus sp. TaxID=2736299 RepID=UPI00257DC41A|nr:cyclic nucleotide-binding domain-containing protein [Syntrophothermus sp.]NSW82084.1 cyclic nucleotide-binding domain-containing protein [Syntrophothermus sp.]